MRAIKILILTLYYCLLLLEHSNNIQNNSYASHVLDTQYVTHLFKTYRTYDYKFHALLVWLGNETALLLRVHATCTL